MTGDQVQNGSVFRGSKDRGCTDLHHHVLHAMVGSPKARGRGEPQPHWRLPLVFWYWVGVVTRRSKPKHKYRICLCETSTWAGAELRPQELPEQVQSETESVLRFVPPAGLSCGRNSCPHRQVAPRSWLFWSFCKQSNPPQERARRSYGLDVNLITIFFSFRCCLASSCWYDAVALKNDSCCPKPKKRKIWHNPLPTPNTASWNESTGVPRVCL